MKRLFALLLLTIFLISCSSCGSKLPDPTIPDSTPPPVTVQPPTPPVKNPLTISESGWEFTLPSDGWKRLETDESNLVVLTNSSIDNLIVVNSSSFDGTLDVLTLEALRGTRASGATVTSVKQVTLNNYNFVLIEAFKSSTKIWMWITVSSNYAFAFSCGGTDNQQVLCAGIFKTFKIK